MYLIELDKSLLGNNLGTLVFTFFSDFFFFGLQKNSDSLYFFPSLFFIPHSSLLSVFYFNFDLIRILTLMTLYSSSSASETDIMVCAACRIMKKGCKADCPFADSFGPQDTERFLTIRGLYTVQEIFCVMLILLGKTRNVVYNSGMRQPMH